MISDVKIQKVCKTYVIVNGVIYLRRKERDIYNLAHSIVKLVDAIRGKIQ